MFDRGKVRGYRKVARGGIAVFDRYATFFRDLKRKFRTVAGK